MKYDPKDLATIEYLGNLYINLNYWEKAMNFFRKSLEIHPNNPYLLEKLGTILTACPDKRFRDIILGREFPKGLL
ncbi:MAG: tetratricopeptide repeat protein [Bacteroidales bacterium]|nr:tetratricopeptide repeat protein [Bacteroidales bacterium]